MHAKQDFIGLDCAHRPDGFYGLAKCFAEDLGRMYWDKRKLECVCLRILSAAQVTSPRALGSWLSYDDLIRLVSRAIDTPTVGFSAVYGVSANDRARSTTGWPATLATGRRTMPSNSRRRFWPPRPPRPARPGADVPRRPVRRGRHRRERAGADDHRRRPEDPLRRHPRRAILRAGARSRAHRVAPAAEWRPQPRVVFAFGSRPERGLGPGTSTMRRSAGAGAARTQASGLRPTAAEANAAREFPPCETLAESPASRAGGMGP